MLIILCVWSNILVALSSQNGSQGGGGGNIPGLPKKLKYVLSGNIRIGRPPDLQLNCRGFMPDREGKGERGAHGVRQACTCPCLHP